MQLTTQLDKVTMHKAWVSYWRTRSNVWSIYDIALLKLILKNLLDDIIIVLIVVSREMNQVLW